MIEQSVTPRSCFLDGDAKMEIQQKIDVARTELKNIRQQLETLKRVHKKEVATIKATLKEASKPICHKCDSEVAHHAPSASISAGNAEQQDSRQTFRDFKPIGYMQSTFKYKNGTPRQPGLCNSSRAQLTIAPEIFNNPAHSLEGLEQFSHVWVLFVFHKNNNTYSKAKVKPPRLDGAKMGLFSTRSPYRPNPIGLSLCRIERVQGATLHLNGVDLLDGTPVLDIKPYIPDYDQGAQPHWGKAHLESEEEADIEPQDTSNESQDAANDSQEADCVAQHEDHESQEAGYKSPENDNVLPETDNFTKEEDYQSRYVQYAPTTTQEISPAQNKAADVQYNDIDDLVIDSNPDIETPAKSFTTKLEHSVAEWLRDPPVSKLSVRFTPSAQEQVKLFGDAQVPDYHLDHLKDWSEVVDTISSVLQSDPRSPYRRKQCRDRLYYFTVDTVHVTCWFDGNLVEVVKVQPLSWVEMAK